MNKELTELIFLFTEEKDKLMDTMRQISLKLDEINKVQNKEEYYNLKSNKEEDLF